MTVATFAAALVLAGTPAIPSDTLPPAPAAQEAPVASTSAQEPPQTPAATATDTSPPAATADASSPPSAPTAIPSPDSDKGDIVVTARTPPPPGDPLASVNAVSFEAVQAVDKAFVAPVTHGYMRGVPSPVRSGIHNLLNNLDEPIVFVNFLLQLKPGKAMETLGRFAINSTIGIGGLIDVAKKRPFYLPRRSNGLADTMGYYGVKPGPYLFLPLIGSTTLRDVIGRMIDLSLVPAVAGKPFNQPAFALAKGTLSALDDRAENDEQISKLQHTPDSYAAMREYYLKKREAEIAVLRGKKPDDAKPSDAAPAPAR